MTKAEQFTAAAAAVVAEYEKEAAAAVALFRMYRDAHEQKHKAMEQAKEAYSSLNNEYYSFAKLLASFLSQCDEHCNMHNALSKVLKKLLLEYECWPLEETAE